MQREYQYDNIKAFLIFCVVLGHILEPFLEGGLKAAYILIYSFHMPMFVMISGMFAKFEPGRILKRIVLPYLVFQGISCLGGDIQFTTPVWTLWYLWALFIWTMLIPFIDRPESRSKAIVVAVSFAAAFLAGYDVSVGYYMSLSRVFVFFPYFVTGFYLRRSKMLREKLSAVRSEYMLLAGGAVCLVLFFMAGKINPKWLYGSYTYMELGYNPAYRAFFYLCGMVLCGVILKVFPKRQTIFSKIGQRSMQVYLLHGFLVGILRRLGGYMEQMEESQLFAAAVFVSCLIVRCCSLDIKQMNCAVKKTVQSGIVK